MKVIVGFKQPEINLVQDRIHGKAREGRIRARYNRNRLELLMPLSLHGLEGYEITCNGIVDLNHLLKPDGLRAGDQGA